jgi:taurine dioxygenase
MNALLNHTTLRPDANVLLDEAGYRARPITAALGAEIDGVDMSAELSDLQVEAIKAAWLQYKVIFFRDQNISHAQHVAFTKRFGPVEGHPVIKHAEGYPEVLIVEAFGEEWVNEKTAERFKTQNKWHTDVTFRPSPSRGSVLRAREVPEFGGDTMWADTAAAYRGLPPKVKDRIAGLTAVHDIVKSYGGRVGPEKIAEIRKEHPPQEHPIVRRHPVTGEETLYVNHVFTTHIVGLEPAESDALLAILWDQIKIPEHHVRFRWTPHAIAFWDNDATQHYAVAEYYPALRIMERVTLSGY